MRKLILIRHGLTDWNATGRFQGHSDISLSSEGRTQAEALAARFSEPDLRPDLVFSSPLSRALETARLAFPEQAIQTDDRLKELHFGLFEGQTLAENEAHPAWDTWYADPFKRSAPQGESYEMLRKRAVNWLKDLPKLERIAAVAHSGTIQMLVSHVLGVERPRWRKRIFLRHSSLSVLIFKGEEIVVERLNDDRHLKTSFYPFKD